VIVGRLPELVAVAVTEVVARASSPVAEIPAGRHAKISCGIVMLLMIAVLSGKDVVLKLVSTRLNKTKQTRSRMESECLRR